MKKIILFVLLIGIVLSSIAFLGKEKLFGEKEAESTTADTMGTLAPEITGPSSDGTEDTTESKPISVQATWTKMDAHVMTDAELSVIDWMYEYEGLYYENLSRGVYIFYCSNIWGEYILGDSYEECDRVLYGKVSGNGFVTIQAEEGDSLWIFDNGIPDEYPEFTYLYRLDGDAETLEPYFELDMNENGWASISSELEELGDQSYRAVVKITPNSGFELDDSFKIIGSFSSSETVDMFPFIVDSQGALYYLLPHDSDGEVVEDLNIPNSDSLTVEVVLLPEISEADLNELEERNAYRYG